MENSNDPFALGKRIDAIFGFCDIRNFTDATEVLQEKILVLTNEIAEIIHGVTDRFCGFANKNFGDSFLLVWKNEDKLIPDLSLAALLKIIASVNLSTKLQKYKEHGGLNARIPNYSIKMGFGFHMGWAIEGAVGSEFLMEKMYISPNVSMASRLQTATKQYGVPTLISLTPETKKYLRCIDIVTMKGSIKPIKLYTFDFDINNLFAKIKISEFDQDLKNLSEASSLKEKNQIKKEQLKKEISENTVEACKQIFEKDIEILAMRETYPEEFFTTFDLAMEKFLKGEWEDAKPIFEKVNSLHPQGRDFPTLNLLNYISESGGSAPPDWKGYRELCEK